MNNNSNYPNNTYTIPQKHRIMENLHIVFWLVKDLCWCLVFRPLGVAMIFPTLIIAIYIAWQSRSIKSELYHNLAVMFWIMANSYWMISEFFKFDEIKVIGNFTGKNMALIPFILGLSCLAVYYLYIMPKEKRNALK